MPRHRRVEFLILGISLVAEEGRLDNGTFAHRRAFGRLTLSIENSLNIDIYIYMYACIFLLLYSSLVPYFHLLLLSILKMLHTRHIWGHGLDDLLPPEGTALRMALPEEVRYDVTEGE